MSPRGGGWGWGSWVTGISKNTDSPTRPSGKKSQMYNHCFIIYGVFHKGRSQSHTRMPHIHQTLPPPHLLTLQPQQAFWHLRGRYLSSAHRKTSQDHSHSTALFNGVVKELNGGKTASTISNSLKPAERGGLHFPELLQSFTCRGEFCSRERNRSEKSQWRSTTTISEAITDSCCFK